LAFSQGCFDDFLFLSCHLLKLAVSHTITDRSMTLRAGCPKSKVSPGKDKETNWLPAPDGTFSLYIRAYWGEPAILDGTWKPPLIEKSK
jgi:hypothetical protein